MTRVISLATALLLLAGCNEPPPSNTLRVSGHVEATETRLAPDAGGRILTFTIREGDRVQVGQQVLTLDPRDVELALERARADRQQAEANLRLVLAGARPEDIRQAESQVTAAQADVSASQAELAAAEQDLQRFETLLTSNSGSRKQRDDAATRRDVAKDRLAAAESRVRVAEQALARLQSGARKEEIEVARARVAAADAQIATLDKSLADTILRSPISGIVTEKLVEAGEVIAPRTPVAVVANLDEAWADVFVPEPAVPRLRLGQPAQLFTDAGGAPIGGTVSYISPKAEFTPRNVQTADERSKLVYRIRIAVDNTAGVLKQGMPVEAELALQPQG
ncbi:MAG TPA: HlyD family efflux transporter periplasmic adaptor subunit [Vicinamibacterales bacterium]|nr:HlyD family efflux transporter periplasmic adaptor subunit [Vicinamibacterales bacterium]